MLTIENENKIIKAAIKILESRVPQYSIDLTLTYDIKALLSLKYGLRKDETFGMILLDSANMYIELVEVSHGSKRYVDVPYRKLVRICLEKNADKVVLFHNHPTAHGAFSPEDIQLTAELNDLLSGVDIVVIDHILVAGATCNSFVEMQRLSHKKRTFDIKVRG